ncbi:MAG TPA: hypothetical protein VGC52_11860 [Gemmatimonadaceae bacterium]
MLTPLRLVAAAALTLLASCAPLLPPAMPTLAPGFEREKVTVGSSTVSNRNSRYNVHVGDHRFRVETRTRVVSAKELAGGDGPSAGERRAFGLLGWALRQAGFNTIDEQIVVGTRTVTERGAPWSLVCQIAWIDQREKSKSETTHSRVTEGMDCHQQPSDSAKVHAPWRFRIGSPTSIDSLASIADTLGISNRATSAVTSAAMERSSADAMRYSLSEESFGTILGMPRSGGWRIHRDDGVTVALLRVPPTFACLGPCAVDFGDATEEERVVLRFIAAALTAPIR